MQIDLSKYNLKDIPFFPNSQINIWANDPRLNGQLFCEEIVSNEAKKLMSLIHKGCNVIYVNSTASVLGTGKSALMASVYWKLTNVGTLTVWTEATGGLSTSSTLGRIIDSMAAQEVFEKIKSKIGEITYSNIKGILLKQSYRQVIPGLTEALTKILQTTPGETAKKFANIRRSVLIWSASEVFGYLLALMEACDMKKPIIFLDQFEEFVRSHIGPAQLRRLANDFNDLLRAIQNRATLIVSLHPEAERVLMGAAGEYIQTIAPINEETMIIVKPLTPDDAVKLTLFYLNHYRMGKGKQELYPFSENVLKYICIKTNGIPRKFITALYDALILGALQQWVPIDDKFISDENNHKKVLPGVSNDWEKFQKGELR
jgi:hypothetical protein